MYSEHPPRYEYHLTQAGADLRPIVLALKEWGDQHVNPARSQSSSSTRAGPNSIR